MTPILASITDTAANLIHQFGINLPGFLMQVASFLIVFGSLYWFAIRPVLSVMDQRAKLLAESLRNAEEVKRRLADTEQECTEILRKAHRDAAAVHAEAKADAKDLLEKAAQDAVKRTEDAMARAQEAIAFEKQRMVQEVRTEIATLVVAASGRLLQKELSDAERSRLNQAAAREVAALSSN